MINELPTILRAVADVLERNGGNVNEVLKALAQTPATEQTQYETLRPGMNDTELRRWAKGKVIKHLYGNKYRR